MSVQEDEAHYPFAVEAEEKVIFEHTQNNVPQTEKEPSRGALIGELVLDLLLYLGELIVPILMWACIIAILAGYIQRSNWNFNTRMTFYAIIAFVCICFLLIRHGANHVIVARLRKSV